MFVFERAIVSVLRMGLFRPRVDSGAAKSSNVHAVVDVIVIIIVVEPLSHHWCSGWKSMLNWHPLPEYDYCFQGVTV